MGRPDAALLAVLPVLLLAGCGDGDEPASTAACDDAAFQAQDEELYVTRTAVSNALAGGGDTEMLLLDVRKARTALGDYLAAHPPCDRAILDVAATESKALDALDVTISGLERGDDAGADIRAALEALTDAKGALAGPG